MITVLVCILTVAAAILWCTVIHMAEETGSELDRIRFKALKMESMMGAYRREKDSLRKRFPYIVNGKFEDGTEATKDRMDAILSDAYQSIGAIRDMALQGLKEGQL